LNVSAFFPAFAQVQTATYLTGMMFIHSGLSPAGELDIQTVSDTTFTATRWLRVVYTYITN
jgi:hypothetical protein